MQDTKFNWCLVSYNSELKKIFEESYTETILEDNSQLIFIKNSDKLRSQERNSIKVTIKAHLFNMKGIFIYPDELEDWVKSLHIQVAKAKNIKIKFSTISDKNFNDNILNNIDKRILNKIISIQEVIEMSKEEEMKAIIKEVLKEADQADDIIGVGVIKGDSFIISLLENVAVDLRQYLARLTTTLSTANKTVDSISSGEQFEEILLESEKNGGIILRTFGKDYILAVVFNENMKSGIANSFAIQAIEKLSNIK